MRSAVLLLVDIVSAILLNNIVSYCILIFDFMSEYHNESVLRVGFRHVGFHRA